MKKTEFEVKWVAVHGHLKADSPVGQTVPPHVKRTWLDAKGRRCAFGPGGGFNLRSYGEATVLADVLNELVGRCELKQLQVDTLMQIIKHRLKFNEPEDQPVDTFPTKFSRGLYETLSRKTK